MGCPSCQHVWYLWRVSAMSARYRLPDRPAFFPAIPGVSFTGGWSLFGWMVLGS